jgi:ABC-type branched-subunit amino acid transport system ATPase component
MDSFIEIKKITKNFSDNQVLKNVSFSLKQGNIYTLIGGNGTGKTTLFNIISGFTKINSGASFFKKKDITNKSPLYINRLGVSRTFQDLRLIEELSVFENIKLAIKNKKDEHFPYALFPKAWLKEYHKKIEKEVSNLLEKMYLNDVQYHLAKNISYGQQKLLTLACCIANSSDLLLLDEPIAGVNEQYQQQILDILLELKKQGKTIFLIEHQPEFIKKMNSTILFLSDGRIQLFDSYTQFSHNEYVQKTYL